MNFKQTVAGVLGVLLGSGVVSFTQAADHSDAPVSGSLVRQDANISDLHAFVSGSNLVLALSTNVVIPPSATSYVFPSDVKFDIYIDVDSSVDTTVDPFAAGGTIFDPKGIKEEIRFRITFDETGAADVRRYVNDSVQQNAQIVGFFSGLRDDPFIRLPREGRNIAAMVLEVPLSSVLTTQSTIIIWATTKVDEFDGPQHEIAGRALRSMFPEQNELNRLHPKMHDKQGFVPEVVIFDTSRPAGFPNGRALPDDVVDLACLLPVPPNGECRVFNQPGEGPGGPSVNDVPFLATFPYLAPPHAPL